MHCICTLNTYSEVRDHGGEVTLVLGKVNFLRFETGVIGTEKNEESGGIFERLGSGE